MLTLDTDTRLGSRAAGRLEDEIVVWLTTVAPSGTPQPTPVWFYWTGTEFLVFSQPDKAKLRNLTGNPRVAVNFNGTETGGDIQVFTGRAVVDENGPTPDELSAYDQKVRRADQGRRDDPRVVPRRVLRAGSDHPGQAPQLASAAAAGRRAAGTGPAVR